MPVFPWTKGLEIELFTIQEGRESNALYSI